jgi:hypothetical protein
VTSNDEVDLAVGLRDCAIGVAPFGRWWWSPLLAVVVAGTVVVLVTSIITPVVSLVVVTIITVIITTIAFAVIAPVVAVVATVVVTSVIAAVVAVIITSIPIVVVSVGSTITIISSIRSTVTIVEALTTIAVVVVVAPSLLGGRWYSKGTLQLLALPHGVLGIAVKLTLVVHDHVEVTFEEGGRSWWICHIGFARSLARPGASIIMVFSVEVMHYRVLRVNQFVDVGHEVANGFCVGFVDLFKQLYVGDSLFVVGDDVVVFKTCKGVAVLEVAIGVFTESFITSHPHSREVVSIARAVLGCMVVGRKETGQSCPGGDVLCWEVVEPQEWCLALHKGEVSRHVVFVTSRGTRHILGSERLSYFSIEGLKSLGYLIIRKRREKAGKLLTAPGLADGAWLAGMT